MHTTETEEITSYQHDVSQNNVLFHINEILRCHKVPKQTFHHLRVFKTNISSLPFFTRTNSPSPWCCETGNNHSLKRNTFHHLRVLKQTIHQWATCPRTNSSSLARVQNKHDITIFPKKKSIPSQDSNIQHSVRTFQSLWLSVAMSKQHDIVICQKKTFKQYLLSKTALVLNTSTVACQRPQVITAVLIFNTRAWLREWYCFYTTVL